MASLDEGCYDSNMYVLQSGVGAVYPGVMELRRFKVKVQCTGRDCDHNINMVTSKTEHFVTLPLFGRNQVVITLLLSQVSPLHFRK